MAATSHGSIWEPNPPHDDAAVFALHREQMRVQTVARFTVMGEPVSKARARFNTKTKSTYTPEKTKTAQERVAWAFRQVSGGHGIDPRATYGLMCIFFHGTNQRRDVDNMVKLVCDGLNGVAWADDSQVTEIAARRGRDAKENARTEVWIYRVGMTDAKLTPCPQCGTKVRTYESWGTRQLFCSRECAAAAKRKPIIVPCDHCGQDFERPKPSSGQRFCSKKCRSESGRVDLTCVACGKAYTYARSLAPKQIAACSDECRASYWREHRKTVAQGTCQMCGGPTSKKSYAHCTSCAPIARRRPKAPVPTVEITIEHEETT